jgi:hypothetical protein
LTAQYRKTATVTARRVEAGDEPVQVYSLEGPATAHPGDYILTATAGDRESWVVRGDIFEKTYELVQPDDTAGLFIAPDAYGDPTIWQRRGHGVSVALLRQSQIHSVLWGVLRRVIPGGEA